MTDTNLISSAVSSTGVEAKNSLDFVQSLLDVQNAGSVAVVIKPDSLLDLTYPIDHHHITDDGGGWGSFDLIVRQPDEIAQVNFTSGTTGKPKAILISHGALNNTARRLNNVMDVDDSIREYVGVPVYHSFGLGRCRAVTLAGGQVYIPNQGFNLSELVQMIASDAINAFSVVPTLARLLLEQRHKIQDCGHKVRWIEIGSQYMSSEEKIAFRELFPNARIIQHYGLTEASRTTFLDISATDERYLDSVGKALFGVEVSIADNGHICIQGPHVASGRIVEGKTESLVTSDGWFETSDLGQIEDGYIYFKGRSDDLINCGGVKIAPHQVESELASQLDHSDLAVSRIKNSLRGEGILVSVANQGNDDMFDRASVLQMVNQTLVQQGVNAADAVKLQFVENLPTTATGKVQRNQLSALYAETTEEALTNQPVSSDGGVTAIFGQIFSGQNIGPDDTFVSLAGDSLNYVRIMLLLEDEIGDLPNSWNTMTISELEKVEAPTRSKSFAPVETNVILRATAITMIVFQHSEIMNLFGGFAFALLVMAGFNFARFQQPRLLSGNPWKPIARYAIKLLIPAWALLLPVYALKGQFEFDVLLMYSNLLRIDAVTIFPIWFIQVLTQVLLIVGCIFSVTRLRGLATASPWHFSLALFGAGVVVRFALLPFWDTSLLFNRVPQTGFLLFTFGWLTYHAANGAEETTKRRLIVTGALAVLILTGPGASNLWFLVPASVLLVWSDHVPVPRFMRSTVQSLASASLHIFLVHVIVLIALNDVLGVTNPWLKFVAAMIASMAVWAVIDGPPAAHRLRRKLLQQFTWRQAS